MRTRWLAANEVQAAAELVARGRLVAFPTETVYGLGALGLEPLAVRAIYAAKGRPATNPVILHVPGAHEAQALVTAWPREAALLAERFWPGPLTLVLPRAAHVPDECTAGGPTVAVRAPSHPLARALLEAVGAPLAAPSANRSEHVSPTSAAHVARDLDGRIDAILDGGDCAVGIESTVVSLAGEPRLLRAGAIARDDIEALIGPLLAGSAGGVAQSPGLHARHYAPAAIVQLVHATLLANAASRLFGRVGALVRAGDAAGASVQKRLPLDAAGYARGLYAALRELEEEGCVAIVIEDVPHEPAWEAIRDRLARAAG